MAAETTSARITDLTVDDHACLTFGEREELFDLTTAYVRGGTTAFVRDGTTASVRDGLAAGLQVVWLSDAGPAVGW